MLLPHVVIIGGGFGGLRAARDLARAPVRITLLDKSNHHLFQPLLYQVATAGLAAPSIAAPIRHIFARQQNLTVLLDEVMAIDAAASTVQCQHGGALAFDYLVAASGATHSYFGHDEWAVHAPGLKTLADAFEIRKRLLLAFEYAERESDAALRARWLTFAVIGAGATGVEMAGTLAEIARQTLQREFRRIDPREASVVLLEGAARVLPPFAEDLSAKARAQLEGLGVEVRTGCRVTNVDAEGVTFKSDQAQTGSAGGTTATSSRLLASTVVWAAGVAASPLGKTLGAPLDRAGRVLVSPDLSIRGHANVFVIGDLASISTDGKPVPGTAPGAKQMGACAAANIRASLAGAARKPFRFQDVGALATIGRHAAVVQLGPVKLWGLPAWLFWLFVHIFFLIDFRARAVVMFEWAWSYLTFERHARVVAMPGDVVPRDASAAPTARQ